MTMQPNEMMEIQQRWGEEVIAGGKLDVLDEIMAEDCVDHDPAPDQGPGREGFKQFWTTMGSAFPDLQATVQESVAADDKLAIRYNLEGTHQGEFMGVPPSGKRVSVAGMQLARFADGKVVERWGSSDELGLMRQIGAVQ